MTWASEFFAYVLQVSRRYAAAEEQAERLRAALEGGAINYDRVSGGSPTGDAPLALIEADQRAVELAHEYVEAAEAVTDLLFGDDGAAKALGEEPAYAAHLHYLEGLSFADVGKRLECSKAWALHQSCKCLNWLDKHAEPPQLWKDLTVTD